MTVTTNSDTNVASNGFFGLIGAESMTPQLAYLTSTLRILC